LERA
jgi:hypothetical protein